MRCLTMANEIACRGGHCDFVCAQLPVSLHQAALKNGHDVYPIATAVPSDSDEPGWELSCWPEEVQRADAHATSMAADARHYDWLVVDHYRLDQHWEEHVRALAARTMVVDDLANRRHRCDMLLDQSPGRSASDYDRLVSRGCELRMGPSHALLRPEFAAARRASMQRRRASTQVERILVSLGMGDHHGVTERVVESVSALPLSATIDVVLSSSAPSLPGLVLVERRDSRIKLHVDTSDMASLMAAADVAIGAAGTTSWERCCVGLPTLLLVLAENQRRIAMVLDSMGAAIHVDQLSHLGKALARLVANDSARADLSARCAAITEGRGAAAVVDEMARAVG